MTLKTMSSPSSTTAGRTGGTSAAKHDAFTAMYESGLWDELPTCEDWSFHFLWCLHAIKWFIAKLDAKELRESA